ncbi:MAG TPA: hypothetical protein VNC85_03300 [Mycobacteriales bacterium]|nr:hypothetical protein [Mycobacteriales bacterium]
MRRASWRWAVVALGVAALVSLPTAIGALPARSSELSATELLAKVKASASVGHSGYAESVGGLDLPLTDDFTALTSLLGDRTRIRSWWRSEDDWRVDAVQTTGEAGTYRDSSGIWSWDYEQDTIVRTSEPTVRLPRVSDVEPAALARRLLSEARASDVSRIPSRRVAGRDAAGLRLRPSDSGTTIDRVDVWVDPATGLALRVEIYGKDTPRPVLETAFLDFSAQAPPPSATRFTPAEPGKIRGETNPDLAAAINVFAPVIPPTTLAGLPGRPGIIGLGSVGTYGSGLTLLVAVPLPGRISRPLRDQLAKTPGATETAEGVRIAVGPLSLLLTDPRNRRSWLITGTVTAQTLDTAAVQLRTQPPVERPR